MEKLSGHKISYMPDISSNHLRERLGDVTVLIMRSKLSLTQIWIDLAPKLKIIGRLGSGMDNIDVDYAKSKGILCCNAPEGNRDAVAEQTIGMLIGLLANIYRSAKEVEGLVWDRKSNSGLELQYLTVGIIGFGNVGSILAQKMKGFGCKIIAYDRFKSGFGTDRVEEVSLEELMLQADVVSLHVPLNSTSRQMIDEDFIRKFKKPFYLLNLSRGEVVDMSAIISGLQSKKIMGCALDVLENENMNTLTSTQRKEVDFLTSNSQVLLTPHIGGLTVDSYQKLAKVLADKILTCIKSYPLVN